MNSNLNTAKKAKNDEFYTQLNDIVSELNAYLEFNPNVFRGKTVLLPCDDPDRSNFTDYFRIFFKQHGLKKLISTSYAPGGIGKVYRLGRGPAFTVTSLKGDGDFRSDEVKELRDEADIIITNPPFSLFREFLAWIRESDKKFIIIGSMNALTYKEVFPLIKENKIWLGVKNGAKTYIKPDKTEQKLGNTCWYTNVEHGRRHRPMDLLTMAENIKHSKHKEIRGIGYKTYDNYDAIEVPFTIAIPGDYDGVMGVPISFLDRYNPEQFEIVGWSRHNDCNMDGGYWKGGKNDATIDGKDVYRRIFIKHKRGAK